MSFPVVHAMWNKTTLFHHRSKIYPPACKRRQKICTFAPRSQRQLDPPVPATAKDDATAREIQLQESEVDLNLDGKCALVHCHATSYSIIRSLLALFHTLTLVSWTALRLRSDPDAV